MWLAKNDFGLVLQKTAVFGSVLQNYSVAVFALQVV